MMKTMATLSTPMSIDDLRPEAVMAAAARATGLDDFGDLGFVEGLTRLLDCLRGEAHLNERGIAMQFHDMVRLLSNRLGFQRDLKAHPELLDEKIEKPIVILGLPRTGTSKLQRMMSADPGVQRLEVWRGFFPAPLPGTAGVTPDPRIALAEEMERTFMALSPELMASHALEAREPDEECWLLEMTFESDLASHKSRAPSHRAWTAERSQLKPYRYMRDLLKYLQWQDGGGRGRPWILKSPLHIGQTPTLFEVFPDATLVFCHRDPRTVIPSYCSVMEANRRIYSDFVDLVEIGDDFMRYWGREITRHLAARRELGEAAIVDVYYEDIRDRPEEVIARAYARAGRELTPLAKQAFADYAARRPEGHFGQHNYTMERYGLSRTLIDATFAEYRERFFPSDSR